MGRFTKISQDAFEGMQLDAGMLLNTFDPANPTSPADSEIIAATTGGIKASCVPTFSDLGEDVDNVPNNMKEFKHLDSWECKLEFTSLGTSPESIKLALGCADIDSNNASRIIPRRDLKQTDFADIWWVGDRADGGFVAVKLINALSDGGFSLQTTKNGKGQVSCSLMGHVSINDQDTMPMEFYSADPDDTALFVELNRARATVEDGASVTLTASATSGATIAWASTDTDVATVADGVVTGEAEGVCVITAKATKSGESAIATCTVTVTEASNGEG